MQKNKMEPELPLGFGMALVQNEGAMQRYAAMSEAQKQAVIAGTHALASKGEMQEYVRHLAAGELSAQ